MPEIGHLGAVVGGLVCIALGASWIPTKWRLGRALRILMVLGGIVGVISGTALYLNATSARANTWYALAVESGSCRSLYSASGFGTPAELISQAGCQYSETNAPGATRLYCPREQIYLYLYPEEQWCENALATYRANIDSMTTQD